MREIFTDLYKKVLGFFQTQEKENVKEVACNRLKLVLMQDRTNLTPFLLEKMRGEMIELLSKYVEMDKEALELNFEQEGDSMALMLSIPVLRAKDEEEIQELIRLEEEKVKQEEENKQVCANEDEEQNKDKEIESDEEISDKPKEIEIELNNDIETNAEDLNELTVQPDLKSVQKNL